MLLAKFIRTASLLLLLPAVGVSVAATATTAAKQGADEAPIQETTSPVNLPSAAVLTDGRQDNADYSYVVNISDSGEVRGRISMINGSGDDVAAAGLPLSISQTGGTVQEVTTDAGGFFTLRNMQPGVYSLYGTSNEAVVAFGFYAVAGHVDGLQINATASSPSDVAEINRIRRHYLPSVELMPGEDTNENSYAKALRQSYLVKTATAPINMDDVARESEGKPVSAALQQQQVALVNGELNGQLSQILGNVIDFRFIHCFLIKNGQVVAEVPADVDGAFTMTGLQSGDYSFVAAGTGGFAAFHVQLTEGAQAQASLADGSQFISAPSAASTTLAVALAAQDAPGAEAVAGDAIGGDDGGAPFMTDGGFGGGGGGGGGGFGGVGGLAALGLGAAAIAIAADDNNNAGLASPFLPTIQP